MSKTTTPAPTTLSGKTIHWTFSEGPTKGTTYEHKLYRDGSIGFRVVEGEGEGRHEKVKQGAVEKISDEVHVISYLSASGYTLTAILNFADGSVVSYASNSEGWFPAQGTFELVDGD
jgi:phenolic acid decarboxylase